MNEAFQPTLYGFKFRAPDERRVRLNEDGTRKQDIKQLWQRSHEILNLALLGYKNTDIAKALNLTPQTVSNTLNSSLGMEMISGKRADRDEEYKELEDDIMDLTRKGLEVYNQILNSPTENMKLRKETADTVILDLAGMRAPTRIDSRSISTVLSPEDIAAFKQRGVDAARAAGKLVEVDEESNQ